MNQILNYVKPELMVVSFVLYFVGNGLKQSQMIKDKFIPLILGLTGIVLCGCYVIANSPLSDLQEIAMAVFSAIVQGILVAGLSTYVNQVLKQLHKDE
ncbi:MAG: phage holin family protein [Clostridiales bacterium]|nr:phage holin family protein [Clostridiales bacterium]